LGKNIHKFNRTKARTEQEGKDLYKLVFQRIGDSPLSEKMPKKMKEYILHFTLTYGYPLLTGSDIVLGIGLIKGNAI
jgi:hypothetical protein